MIPIFTANIILYQRFLISLFFQSGFAMQVFLRCILHSVVKAINIHMFVKQILLLEDNLEDTDDMVYI